MFLQNDSYTLSGNLSLYHSWTDKVTKFDSSAFYNWEQDNMPIYDLEERTYLLWEQMGFPTSAITGAVLTVSADASDQSMNYNRNIFRSLSSAVDALPQNITFPIIIEVANFGNLNDLILNNYKFGPRGSLEIINRNFATCDSRVSSDYSQLKNSNKAILKSGTNPFGYCNSVSSIRLDTAKYEASSVSSVLSILGHFNDSQCGGISSKVFSSIKDARLPSNVNGFVSKAKYILESVNSLHCKSTLAINSAANYNADLYQFDFTPYEPTGTGVDGYDVSTMDYLSNKSLIINDTQAFHPANQLFFGNKLSKVIISNCDGPIYLRNFFLDGEGNGKTNNNNGVEISNSNNVYLENIVCTRYRKSGFLFNNSKITLLGGCVATRIYDFASDNKRLLGPWPTTLPTLNQLNINETLEKSKSAGLIANSSDLLVSSTKQFYSDKHFVKLQSTLKSGQTSYTYAPYFNSNYIFEFSNNTNGIILNNSKITGGDIPVTDVNHFYNNIEIDIYGNTNNGIELNNSQISLNGKLNIFENNYGIKANSSLFEIDKIYVKHNQSVGLDCFNSKLIYNKNLASYYQGGANVETDNATEFKLNGGNIVLDNSKFTPKQTSSMGNLYGPMILASSIGVNYTSGNQLLSLIPAVVVKNNSYFDAISPYFSRDVEHTNSCKSKGSELLVDNNSKAVIRGTKYFASRIFGPIDRVNQKNLAAACANNNSTLEINGPTIIAQFGVDLLADNKSFININPPMLENSLFPSVIAYNLSDPGNHTAVELHSTRSCIVVDNNSIFNAKDLGSFKECWDATGSYYTSAVLSGISYEIDDIHQFVSGGSLQFYPNPLLPTDNTGNNGQTTYNSNAIRGVDNISDKLGNPKFTKSSGSSGKPYYLLNTATTTQNDYSSVTRGGYCVRALNNSLVDIKNVNFPCGWWNASAIYFDAAIDDLCSKLFIWNLADNSKLNSTYTSVHGFYPKVTGYRGPSGVWTSGQGKVASGLPSGTPDTSSVSVLDYYGGAAASANPFGKIVAENFGPFRLYFSINDAINSFTDISSITYNILPQIYSQGYQPSGSIICSGTTSSIHSAFALQRNSAGVISPSGYYYGTSIMSNNNIKVFLDQSSSEIFANAKHCSVGKSGNSKSVSIFYPYTYIEQGRDYTDTGIKSPNSFNLEEDN